MPHVLAQDLRNAVLQAAITGKLTEKLSTDSDVNELLTSIKIVKEKLIKEKKIKKEKNLKRLDIEESIDIPDNWVLTQFGTIFNVRSAMRIHESDWRSSGVPFLRGRELVKLSKTGILTSDVYIEDSLYEDLKNKGGIPKKDDILITAVGTLGKTYVVNGKEGKYYYKDAYILCLENYGVNPLYIKYLLDSPFSQLVINDSTSKGTTVAQLTISKLKSMSVPLPPIEEQARIVARVDELMAKIDEYEKIEKELAELQKAFPGNMKDAILQAAMQGKLTEQLESDGDACELIASIDKIREQGVKDKAIRKAKGISTFTEDDIPYDVPENWGWMRFGSLVANCDGDRKPVSKELRVRSAGGIYPYYGATGAIDKVDDYLFDGEYLMIGEDGGNFFVNRDNSFIARGKFWANNHVHVVKPIEMNIKYLKGFLDSCNLPLMGLINGIAVPKLNQENLNSIMVPVPPIEEQQRIVDKLDQLLPLCEQLEKMVA